MAFNPAVALMLMQQGLGLWQQAQSLRVEAQRQAAEVAGNPGEAVQGLADAAQQAAKEYPELYRAAADYMGAVTTQRRGKKPPEAVAKAEANLMRELAQTYSLLTGMAIPPEIAATWGDQQG